MVLSDGGELRLARHVPSIIIIIIILYFKVRGREPAVTHQTVCAVIGALVGISCNKQCCHVAYMACGAEVTYSA